jgi:ABC-type dipeptide/oligopeptide/nickel transport system ATPase component
LEKLAIARRTPSEVAEAERRRMAHEDELWHRRRSLDKLFYIPQNDRIRKTTYIQNLDEALHQWRWETKRRLPALRRVQQEAMQELMEGRTTVIIAHRLSTVRKADRIMVFDGGRIVEAGRHSDLVQRPHGLYRRLVGDEINRIEIEAA